MICKYFLFISFHFLAVTLEAQKFLNFDEVWFIYFSFGWLFFWVSYLRNHCLVQDCEDLHLYFLLRVLYF